MISTNDLENVKSIKLQSIEVLDESGETVEKIDLSNLNLTVTPPTK